MVQCSCPTLQADFHLCECYNTFPVQALILLQETYLVYCAANDKYNYSDGATHQLPLTATFSDNWAYSGYDVAMRRYYISEEMEGIWLSHA